MKQLTKRLTALLLAVVLALGVSLPALAEEAGTAGGETVTINTVDDLLALQTRCIVDTATQNLTVKLQADLDLTGHDFTGLPVFSGHFDGQGHTISGLVLGGGGDVQGFFRYLEASAVVEDLHLQGTTGGADATIQGLLAGENRGLVRGCSASGQVTANQEAGGLVGRNETSGQIINCQNHAAVQADRMAGGIAGQNLGSIVRCQNDGAVNTILPDAAGKLVGIDLSGEDGAALAAVSDIGGITGRSGGILQSCQNSASIGYASVGNNVGGIVGRTSGYLDGCVNSGTVQGSQDVGGVAGQLEPVLTVQYDGGKLDALYNELDALQTEMDTLLTDMDTSGDGVSAALSNLTEATRTAKDSTSALADGMIDWADGGIEAVNSAASRFSWVIDHLGPVLDSIGTALEQADAAGDALEQILQDAAAVAELGEEAQAQLQTAAEAFAAARSHAHSALEHAYNALQALRDALGNDSESQAAWQTLADALASLRSAAAQVQDAVQELDRLLSSFGTADGRPQELENLLEALRVYQQARDTMLQSREDIHAQLTSDAPDLSAILAAADSGLEAAGQAVSATNDMLTALDALTASLTPAEVDALRTQIETLQATTESFRAALEQVHTAAEALQWQGQTSESALSTAWEELCAAVDQLFAAGDSLNTGLEALAAAVNALQSAWDTAGETLPADLAALKTSLQAVSQALQSAVAGIEKITTGLAGQPTVTVPSLDSTVAEQSDALNTALGTLLDGFDALNTAVNAAGDTLTGDLRAVNDQLGRVVDAVRALTSSPDANESEAVFTDVSREQAEQLLQEQGNGCLVNAGNTGEILGDSCVGGIVGSLANELDTDPAGHWQQDGTGSALSAEVQLRLIVLDSRNSGTVTAKKEAAGGVAGRMDFGYAADCENTGNVTGTTQVGGIAGQSAGILESCWARCALTGDEEVGGIAGYGAEITGCRTMVELLPGEDGQPIRYAGTIAGRVPTDAALADNQYIHESLGAVDGVTRAAQALPASFEELASDPAAPDGFARLELTFVADGKTVATVTFRYGEGVTSLPAVPQKDGYVGQWPDLDYSNLTYSQTVEAEYIPYASALADDSGETPQVLVDGSFSPQAQVNVATAETSFSDADGRTHSGTAYTVTVTDPVFGASDCTVHFRKPDTAAHYTVWVQQGDTWVKQKPQVDGSYLLIDCPGGQITFMAEVTTANIWFVLLAALVVIFVAVVFALVWCKRTRKPQPAPPEAKDDSAQGPTV